MLEATGLRSGYGDVVVIDGVDFTVGEGIFAVLGANGAGKSTLLRTIARLLPLRAGALRFEGRDLATAQPYELAGLGLAYVPQEGNVFPGLSVRENLHLGGKAAGGDIDTRMERIFDIFPDVEARLDQIAGTLSGGESQMVAIGRALMQEPRLLLLDEPTAGLAPKYVDGLFARIKEVHERHKMSILLAEQNAVKTLAIADRLMVLSLGKSFLIEDTKEVDLAELISAYRI